MNIITTLKNLLFYYDDKTTIIGQKYGSIKDLVEFWLKFKTTYSQNIYPKYLNKTNKKCVDKQ